MADEEREDTTATAATADAADTAVAEENAAQGAEAAVADLADVITVSVADAGTLRKSISVSVPADRIQQERDKQYSELINDAIVPGFRKGHAPRKLVEKRFGSEVGDQVLTKLVSSSYMAAIKKEKLEALGDPVFRLPFKKPPAPDAPQDRLVDFSAALKEIVLPAEGPLTYTCEVEVKPEFELPDLDGIPVEKPVLTVTDEDVDKQIDRNRAVHANWVPVVEGAVQTDDMVIADVKMTVGDEVVKQQENVSLRARPQRVEGVTLDTLGEVLAGAKPGDVRTTTGTVVNDDERENLRGKPASFEFRVNDIKRLNLPPLDAAHLASVGMESLDEYRGAVRRYMESQIDQEIRRGMRGQVCKYLLDQVKLDLPEALSQRQIDRTVLRRAIELQRQGVPTSEIEKHADELRTQSRERATTELRLHFIIEKVADQLEVTVSEEELNSQIMAIARHYGHRFDRMRDDLAKNNGIESLYLQIRDDKTVDMLLEKAKISETAGPPTSATVLADAT